MQGEHEADLLLLDGVCADPFDLPADGGFDR